MLDLGGAMVEPQPAVDNEFPCSPVEPGDGDRIAENILKPSDIAWLGIDFQRRIYQMLVVTLTRTHHYTMFAERYRLAVRIGGDV
jgi:hypothetical protein